MLTQAILKNLLHYDPETGVFTRKVRTSNRVNIGDTFGIGDPNKYTRISVFGRQIAAQILAWVYVYGETPPYDIDHVNTHKGDNRIDNLRLATRKENMFNRGATKISTSGFKGVVWANHAQRWKAQAMIDGKNYNLGYFNTPEDASVAYNEFAKAHHGEFYHDTTKSTQPTDTPT